MAAAVEGWVGNGAFFLFDRFVQEREVVMVKKLVVMLAVGLALGTSASLALPMNPDGGGPARYLGVGCFGGKLYYMYSSGGIIQLEAVPGPSNSC